MYNPDEQDGQKNRFDSLSEASEIERETNFMKKTNSFTSDSKTEMTSSNQRLQGEDGLQCDDGLGQWGEWSVCERIGEKKVKDLL